MKALSSIWDGYRGRQLDIADAAVTIGTGSGYTLSIAAARVVVEETEFEERVGGWIGCEPYQSGAPRYTIIITSDDLVLSYCEKKGDIIASVVSVLGKFFGRLREKSNHKLSRPLSTQTRRRNTR